MAIGRDGLLYVADTWNDRIEVFTTQGVFIRQWPTPDPDGDEHPDALLCPRTATSWYRV